MAGDQTTKLKIEGFCRTCGKQIPPLPVEHAFCVSCRYDTSEKPATIHAPSEYDIAAETIPAPAESELPEENHFSGADALKFIHNFLMMMTNDATASPLQIGQRMIVLLYLAGLTKAKTQRELADELNVSPGRITQILQAIPADFQSLLRLKSRTAKRHAISE